jgi:DNA polymerase/3'-5' exonuclease PolX
MEDLRRYVAERLELEALQAGSNAFRARAIRSCAQVVRAAPAFDDAASAKAVLSGSVTARMMDRISEILETPGSEEPSPEAKIARVMQELMTVTCIGQVAARRLANSGVQGIDDLERAVLAGESPALKLTAAQELCVRYRRDIAKRIPRSEMHAHVSRVHDAAQSAGCKAEVVGSYRRNATSSGDVDVLLVGDIDAFLTALYPEYVVGAIAKGAHKFMGLVKLPGSDAARRIDVLATTAAELPFAMLHFTGPADFNVALRKIAMTKGMRLSEKGWDRTDICATSEADILAELGVQWTQPQDRSSALSLVYDPLENRADTTTTDSKATWPTKAPPPA